MDISNYKISVKGGVGRFVNPYEYIPITQDEWDEFKQFATENQFHTNAPDGVYDGKEFGDDMREMRARKAKEWTAFKYKVENIASDETYMLNGWVYDTRIYREYKGKQDGINHKFNDFIQAIHRIYRFGQVHNVEIHIVYTEQEQHIRKDLS